MSRKGPQSSTYGATIPPVHAPKKRGGQKRGVTHKLTAATQERGSRPSREFQEEPATALKKKGRATQKAVAPLVAPVEFPEEILRQYSVYRQLQSALVRIGNQIKAIQKHDKTHAALAPLIGMQTAGKFDYKLAEEIMINAVHSIPVCWKWMKIRGLAANSIGQILGETKDLNRYANPAKLWKRMGLGLVDGHRQQF